MSNNWVKFDKNNPKLAPGKYEYMISKPGYETIIDEMEVVDKPIEINKVLKSNGFMLKITTTPVDAVAKVEINGHFIEGKEFSLSPGIYNYEVSKDTFTPKTGSVDIVDRNRDLNVSLSGVKYRLAILCNYDEAIVEVQIDGVYITGNIHRLVPGDYKYRVTMTGYSEITGTAKIFDKDIIIPVSFDEDKFRVTFDVTPKNSLTELQIGRDWFEGTEYDLLPGKYTYVVSHKGYKDEVGVIYVNDQDILNYEVNLESMYDMSSSGKLAIGYKFTLYIEDGKIYGMGKDDYGQISNIPVGNNFVQVAAGLGHGVALDSTGKLYTWGDSRYGVQDISKLPKYKMISAGHTMTAALTINGDIEVSGGTPITDVNGINNIIKYIFPKDTKYISVSVGDMYATAIREDGSVLELTWYKANNNIAAVISSTVTNAIYASSRHYNSTSVFINSDLNCVDLNNNLLDTSVKCVKLYGDSVISLSVDDIVKLIQRGSNHNPTNMPNNTDKYKYISAYYPNAGGITEDGEVRIWGDNSEGQCDLPDGKNRLVFNITPKNAIVEVTTNNGILIANNSNNHTVRVEPGSYSYTATSPNYVSSNGIAVSNKYSSIIYIKLDPVMFTVNLISNEYNTNVEVYDYGTKSVIMNVLVGTSSKSIKLIAGSEVKFTFTKDKYHSSFIVTTINKDNMTVSRSIYRLYTVKFIFSPLSPEITSIDLGGRTLSLNENNEISVGAGYHNWVISHPDYDDRRSSFTITNSDIVVNVDMFNIKNVKNISMAGGSLILQSNNINKTGMARSWYIPSTYDRNDFTPRLTDLIYIDTTDRVGMAIRSDNSLVAWSTSSFDKPRIITDIPTTKDFVKVIAGEEVAFAINKLGAIKGWPYYKEAVKVLPTGGGYRDVFAVSSLHSTIEGGAITLNNSGKVETWGYMADAWWDTPPTGSYKQMTHTMAPWGGVTTDGRLALYGYGSENNMYNSMPKDSGFVKIQIGGYNNTIAMALRSNGVIEGWSQFADNSYNKSVINLIPRVGKFIDINIAFDSYMALRDDGVIIAWGGNISDPAKGEYVEINSFIKEEWRTLKSIFGVKVGGM